MSGAWPARSPVWWVVPAALALALAALGALTATAPPAPGVAVAAALAGDQTVGLRRCRDEGEAAAQDADCARVWRDSRDRFLRVRR